MTEGPRWWVEGLRAALVAAGLDDADRLAADFAALVPGSYVERTPPDAAAADLLEVRALLGSAGPGEDGAEGVADARRMAVQADPDPGAGMFRFRLYGRQAIELSSFLPVLESFGLTVVEAVPHHLRSADGHTVVYLDDFGLRARLWPRFDPAADGPRLVAAVQAAWAGQSEVDSLNRLVVCADLDWHDVVVLRAYRRYRRHVGTPWSDRQLDDPLVQFPEVAGALIGYFRARFDPAAVGGSGAEAAGGPGAEGADGQGAGLAADGPGAGVAAEWAGAGGAGAAPAEAAAREAVAASLSAVERLEQDQVLRAYLALIDATVRTSHFARTPAGARLPTLALKLDSARVPELPPPRPHLETFVYSPRVEGLHLRGGPIARGGIRWSDRQDDLRTEVLGLVRAQVLKNAGIVPTGAKGGYACKYLAGGDGPLPAAGSAQPVVDVKTEIRECYRLFVSALLDVTDNVVAGQAVAPPGVRPRDVEDTYLVVAADRGTATFSDLANEISDEHHFWLGDAFASGGSRGYDHKAMGITARGAWVAARQHFRQLGIDPEKEEIRVTGVGDMSGDVFGNGMLRSRTMKLVAAFDYRHVFMDPDPDPARSFAERDRLFALPASSWRDYDPDVISEGGGVWSRTSKEIVLSPQAQAVVGLRSSSVNPPQLISAILTASADLLWLGGIGTFVKAPTESHADVGDRADDAVRVDADQVRARVVAEGGNLGFTQRARIVYSRRGGRINTDFVDNAAGVATSDYEVNLKILLGMAIEEETISWDERNQLLASVEDDVAAAVLRDVGLTALAVTRAVPASAVDLDAYDALMSALEAEGRLERKVEFLPSADDMAVRRAAGAGLTRPEAAVLLAMAKSDLADALEISLVVADPAVEGSVRDYFPPSIMDRFGDLVTSHRLYRQLAATRVASEMIDRMGITWAHETADEFGAGLAGVAAAYWAARQVLGGDRRWRRLEELASVVSADAEAVLELTVAQALHTLARRYLADPSLAAEVGEDALVVATLDRPGDGGGRAVSDQVKVLLDQGVPEGDAEEFGRLAVLALAADLGRVLRVAGFDPSGAVAVLAAFETFDRSLELMAFRQALGRLACTSRWGRWQVRRLEDDLLDLQRQAVLASLAAGGNPGAAMERWLDARATQRARFLKLANLLHDPEASAESLMCLAAVAVRALSDLVKSVVADG